MPGEHNFINFWSGTVPRALGGAAGRVTLAASGLTEPCQQGSGACPTGT